MMEGSENVRPQSIPETQDWTEPGSEALTPRRKLISLLPGGHRRWAYSRYSSHSHAGSTTRPDPRDDLDIPVEPAHEALD